MSKCLKMILVYLVIGMCIRAETIQIKDSINRNILTTLESNANLRGVKDDIKFDGSIKNGDVYNTESVEDIENLGGPVSRTATGGFVNTIMVSLTVFAFLGNGAFMVYVFWLSK